MLSFWVDSYFHYKKLFFAGITGVVILTTVLVFYRQIVLFVEHN